MYVYIYIYIYTHTYILYTYIRTLWLLGRAQPRLGDAALAAALLACERSGKAANVDVCFQKKMIVCIRVRTKPPFRRL